MARLTLLLIAAFVAIAAADLRRVCYYTNWAQYRNGPAKFYPENVDPSLCTHIIYAFAKLNGNKLQPFEWNDESTPWMKGMYERFDAVKKSNPSVKTLLSVGGWNMGSAPFTKLVSSEANMREFARTTVAFLRKHDFDGIDIDWEYPANRGSPPVDRHRFTELLRITREEFAKEAVPAGKQTLLLTAAVGAGESKINTGYEVPEISSYLDMINLMSYDLHGSWEDKTGHVAPLYARSGETGNQTTLNVDWAAQKWVSMGAPRDKINIGLSMYGRTFKLPYSHKEEGMGAPAKGAGAAGLYTREAGFMSYYEVCAKLKAGATRHYDQEQKVPYLVDRDLWVGYEDKDSLITKVDYTKKEGFGGVMIWSLDLDDFSGSCGEGKYPLMRAIVDELKKPTPGGVLSTRPIVQTTTRAPIVTTRVPVQTNPPMTNPPMTNPPQTNPPMTNPPQTNPPQTTMQTQPPPKTNMPTTTAAPVTTTKAAPPDLTTVHVAPVQSGHHQITMVQSTEFNCNGRPDGYHASPTACNQYYICANSLAFRTDCHPGLYFNDATLYCDFPDHVNCNANKNPAPVNGAPAPTNPPMTQPPQTQPPQTRPPQTQPPQTQPPQTQPPQTQPPITTTVGAPGAVAPKDFCQGKSDGFYRDPVSCSYFYQCSFHISYHDPCPGGTYYSTSLQGCDWAANVPNCP